MKRLNIRICISSNISPSVSHFSAVVCIIKVSCWLYFVYFLFMIFAAVCDVALCYFLSLTLALFVKLCSRIETSSEVTRLSSQRLGQGDMLTLFCIDIVYVTLTTLMIFDVTCVLNQRTDLSVKCLGILYF